MGDYFGGGKLGCLPPDHSGSWTRKPYCVTKTPYTGLWSLPSTTTNLRLKKGVTRKLTNRWETRDRHVSVHLLRSWCERKPRKKLSPKMVIERVYSQLRAKSSHFHFNSFSTNFFSSGEKHSRCRCWKSSQVLGHEVALHVSCYSQGWRGVLEASHVMRQLDLRFLVRRLVLRYPLHHRRLRWPFRRARRVWKAFCGR